MAWNSRRKDTIVLTREELYEKVWAEAMRTLAPKFGLSDVGLAKVCKRFNIPRPGLGYWAKKEAGKKVKQVPLPPFEGPNEIVLRKSGEHNGTEPKKEPELPEPISRAIEFEKSPENRIEVCSDLRRPHPLITQSRPLLENAETDDFGRLVSLQRKRLDIQVSKPCLRRALLLMNSLLLACESRGFQVQITKGSDGQYSTYVTVSGEDIGISLDEKLNKEEAPPDDWTVSFYRDSGMDIPKSFRFVPSGILRLRITEGTCSRIRKQWMDTPKQQVEECLNDFMVSLFKVSNDLRNQEEERKRREEERRKEEQIRADQWRKEEEARRAREEEARKIENLKDMAQKWHESQLIQSFLDDVEKRARATCGEKYETSEVKEFVEWGRKVVADLDPVKEDQ